MSDARRQADILILRGLVVTMDSQWRVLEDGALAIVGMNIVAVGSSTDLAAQYDASETIDATGHIVMPGLVNAHTHAPAVLFRGLLEDLTLEPWLEQSWLVEKRILNPDSIRLGAQLAHSEMIQGGTTTALDMYWFPEVSVKVAKEIGFRLVTGPAYLETPDPPDNVPDAERTARGREFLQQYCSDPLVTPCVQPHSTYTVSPRYLREARELADEFQVLMNTHASESKTEVKIIQQNYGTTPPRHLEANGFFTGRTVLAHCVQLDQTDIELLAARPTAAAHCPISNLKIGAGIAPVSKMLSAGMRVVVGTDGAQSSNDLDMWKAMRMSALLQKGINYDATLMPARQVVRMATSGSAEALGLADKIGALEAGKRADVILVELKQPHSQPFYDAYSHLVYSAGREDVTTVLINGRKVMQGRHLLTIDQAETIDRVNALSRRIHPPT